MTADALRALPVDEAVQLADYAERPRVDTWTLRSALVRSAQQAPVAASAVLELVRRTDAALAPHRRDLERTAIADLSSAPAVVDLLSVAVILDELGEVLAAWAHERAPADPPTAAVDEAASQAFARLAELGVPRETRPPRRAG